MLADGHGSVIHLGERDCSIQRRHQKLIEESPAPMVDEAMRERIGKIATEAARAVDYRGAGTIEGLLQDGEYYFLEMNTRVQVEHCVTEATTGIDIVREQIRIAAGEPLSVTQDEVVLRGHAIECRINAEDASKNFAPAPGTVTRYREPSGPGVRVDSGVLAGSEITPLYDPMVAKLIVWDADRESATRRMARALEEFDIDGVRTLIPFHKAIMASEQWARAETCRDLVEDREWLKTLAFEAPPNGSIEGEPEPLERTYTVEVSGKRFDVRVLGDAIAAPAGGNSAAPARPRRGSASPSGGGGGARRRHARLPAPGQRLQGAGRAGRHRRGGRAGLHHRGDEDGERDRRPQGGRDRRAADLRGRRGLPPATPSRVIQVGMARVRRDQRDRDARHVLRVDLPHRAVPPRERQLGVRAALQQRDEYARSSRRIASARSESSTAPCPGTTCAARSTSGSSRSSVARYADTEPPAEIHGISTGER